MATDNKNIFDFENRKEGEEIQSDTRDLNNQNVPPTITRPMESVSQPIFSRDERVALTLLPLASALLQGKAPGGQSLLSSTLATAGQGLAASGNVALRIKELEGQRRKEIGTGLKSVKLQPTAGPVEIQGKVFTPDMGREFTLDAATRMMYPPDTFTEVTADKTTPKFEPKKFRFTEDVELQDGTKYQAGQEVSLLPKDSLYLYNTYGAQALKEIKDVDPPSSLKPINFMVDIFQKGSDDIKNNRRFSFGQAEIAKAFLLAEAESKPKRVTIKLPGGVEEQRIVRDLDYVKNLKNIYGDEVFEQLWTYANLGENFYANLGDDVAQSETAIAQLERPIDYDALRTGKSSDIVIARRVNLPDAAKKTLASASSVIQDLANVRRKLFKDGVLQRDILLTPNKVKVLKSGAVSYARSMQRAVETLLRQRSGAAITKQEFDRYQNLYVPTTLDSEEVVKQKLLAMEREFGTIIKLINSGKPVQIYDSVNDIMVDAENNGMTLEEQWEKGIFKDNKTIKTNEADNETGGASIN